MNLSNKKISMHQLICILVLEIFSTSFLALPSILYNYTKQDSWIIVFISGLIVYLALSTYLFLYKKDDCYSYLGFLQGYFGKISSIIIWLFIIKNILFISYELSYFTTLVTSILLPKSSKIVIYILVISFCYYFSKKGIETRGRLAEFLAIILLIVFAIFFIIVSFDADYTNIFPIGINLNNNNKNLSYSIYFGLMAFSGLEYIYILIPFLKNKDEFQKASLYTVMATTIFISITTLITIIVFNKQMLEENYPVLMILNSITLPFDFIERQDALVFSLWIVGSVFTISAGLFYSSILFKNIKSSSKVKIDEILVITTFLITLFINKYLNIKLVGIIIFSFNLFFLLCIPFVCIFIFFIRKIFRDKNKIKLSVITLCISSILLSSCTKANISSRDFVESLYITYEDNKYTLHLFTAPLDAYVKNEQENEANIITAEGSSIIEAIKLLDNKTTSTLDFSHTKTLILGENFYKNETHVNELIDLFYNNTELSRKSNIYTCDYNFENIKTIISKGFTIEKLAFSSNVSELLYNQSNYDFFILNNIKVDDDTFISDTGNIFINNNHVLESDEKYTRGYMFIEGDKNIQKDLVIDNDFIIKDYSKKDRVELTDNKINYTLNIDLSGKFASDTGDIDNISKIISDEAIASFVYFNNISKKILKVEDEIYKSNYTLYKMYLSDSPEVVSKFNVIVTSE